MPRTPPRVICLTPVKNESWILESFLRAASLWADQIVIADGGSDDGSQAVAQRHPRVLLIEDEGRRHEGRYYKLLLATARQIARRPVLISLDADEMLSANWRESDEWQRVQSASSGTVIFAQFVNVLPGLRECWRLPEVKAIGHVDDGVSEYPPFGPIHHPRVPCPTSDATLVLDDIKVLHLQSIDPAAMESKQRWYQCWERVHFPSKRPIQIYRQYHGENVRPPMETEPMRREWTCGYEALGIRMSDLCRDPPYYWDAMVLELLSEYGAHWFSKVDIWDVDWTEVARAHGRAALRLQDPRSSLEQHVQRWLGRTQRSAHRKRVRYIQRALRILGW